MKLLAIVLSLVIIVQAGPGFCTAPPETHGAALSVKVTDPTGAPIPNARVGLFSAERKVLLTRVTDGTGTVFFDGLQGTFQVEVSAQGFFPVDRSIEIVEKKAQEVGISLKVGYDSGPVVYPERLKSEQKDSITALIIGSAEIPRYPPLARAARIQGTVKLLATTDGLVIVEVKATGAHRLLMDAAERNLRTWRLNPHIPTTFQVSYTYRFAGAQERPYTKAVLDDSPRMEIVTAAPSTE